MDPRMWGVIIQMVMMASRPQAPAPINVNVDLSAIRDLLGKKGFIQGGEEEDTPPLPVNIMNAPIPYPSG